MAAPNPPKAGLGWAAAAPKAVVPVVVVPNPKAGAAELVAVAAAPKPPKPAGFCCWAPKSPMDWG